MGPVAAGPVSRNSNQINSNKIVPLSAVEQTASQNAQDTENIDEPKYAVLTLCLLPTQSRSLVLVPLSVCLSPDNAIRVLIECLCAIIISREYKYKKKYPASRLMPSSLEKTQYALFMSVCTTINLFWNVFNTYQVASP